MKHGRAYEKLNYAWETEKLSQAIIPQKEVRRNKQDIKQAIDSIKRIMAKETDYTIKRTLAVAGVQLNNLLIR